MTGLADLFKQPLPRATAAPAMVFKAAPERAGFARIFKRAEPQPTGFAHVLKDGTTAGAIKGWLTRDHGKAGLGANYKGKFKQHDDKAKALVMNHKLGVQYYTVREKFGKDSPQTKEAYAEWQKSKDFLLSKHGVATSEQSSLSVKAKETASQIASGNAAAHTKAKQGLHDVGKEIADMPGETLTQDKIKGATGFQKAVDAAKEAGLSAAEVHEQILAGHDMAKKAKAAAAQQAEHAAKAAEEAKAKAEIAEAKAKQDKADAHAMIKASVQLMGGEIDHDAVIASAGHGLKTGLSEDEVQHAIKEGYKAHKQSEADAEAAKNPQPAADAAPDAKPKKKYNVKPKPIKPATGEEMHMALVSAAYAKKQMNPDNAEHAAEADKVIAAAKEFGLTNASLAAVKAHVQIKINKNAKALEKAKADAPEKLKPAEPVWNSVSESYAATMSGLAISKAKEKYLSDPNKSALMAKSMSADDDPAFPKVQGGYTSASPAAKHGNAVYNALSPSQKSAVKYWTGSGYSGTNKAMNAAKGADGSTQPAAISDDAKAKKIKDLAKALDNDLGSPMKLRRNMPSKWLFKELGLPHEDRDAMWNIPDHELQKLVGKTYKETSFSSTTWNTSSGICLSSTAQQSGSTHLSINAPATTKGLFVDTNSTHSSENEVLLQKGATYIIKGITKAKTKPSGNDSMFKFDVEWIGADGPDEPKAKPKAAKKVNP